MVTRHLWFFLAAAAVSFHTFADAGYEDADDDSAPHPVLMPSTLPPIATVTVTTASTDVRSEEEKQHFPESFRCDDFQVTQGDIEAYFRLTKEISQQDYMHAIDWVPCHASGEIRFTDGSEGKWNVMMSAAGVVTFSDGAQTFLFCDQCTEPFVPE